MITFFCSPRPFSDSNTSTIQLNAIRSWLALDPSPEVLLIGDDFGVAEVAAELSIGHIRQVATDSKGIPMRSSMCQLARAVAKHDFLCIINADIVILEGFYEALNKITLPQFVAAGRRFNLDVKDTIRFEEDTWRERLRQRTDERGVLCGPSTVDYAVYPKRNEPPVLPPFPVNSFGWDPWFLFAHRKAGIPVVDLTPAVTVIHQNHESSAQVRIKRRSWRRDKEAMSSLRKHGGFSNMMTLREADYQVHKSGLARLRRWNQILSLMLTIPLYRWALGCKRAIRGWLV